MIVVATFESCIKKIKVLDSFSNEDALIIWCEKTKPEIENGGGNLYVTLYSQTNVGRNFHVELDFKKTIFSILT